MMEQLGLKSLPASALLGFLAAAYIGVAIVSPNSAASPEMWLPFMVISVTLTIYTIIKLRGAGHE